MRTCTRHSLHVSVGTSAILALDQTNEGLSPLTLLKTSLARVSPNLSSKTLQRLKSQHAITIDPMVNQDVFRLTNRYVNACG